MVAAQQLYNDQITIFLTRKKWPAMDVEIVSDEYIEGLKAEIERLREALIHAEAILTYTPRMSTNKGGKGPSTSTGLALGKVRAALSQKPKLKKDGGGGCPHCGYWHPPDGMCV